jgi:hypothetical protein
VPSSPYFLEGFAGLRPLGLNDLSVSEFEHQVVISHIDDM